MSISPDFPARLLRTEEAAAFLGLSRRTLEKHRVYGTGPRYVRLGGRVVYKIAELQAWAERGVRASTCDPGGGVVLCAKRHDPETIALASRVPEIRSGGQGHRGR